MVHAGPRSELRVLGKYLAELEKHFLRVHLASQSPPALRPPSRNEVLDAAAFVVLAHGALENFVEGVALWAIDRIVNTWIVKQRAGRCTAAVLLTEPVPTPNPRANVYDQLRTALNSAKTRISHAVESNHGIEARHLRALFDALGVDVPRDPQLIAAIDSVVQMRHHWAHRYRFGATIVKSAADVKSIVDDCLRFANELISEVTSARP
jgi:HEPN superfamily RiboL-PSP-like protein